jgi:hypothetical protein
MLKCLGIWQKCWVLGDFEKPLGLGTINETCWVWIQ